MDFGKKKMVLFTQIILFDLPDATFQSFILPLFCKGIILKIRKGVKKGLQIS